jgi:membrane protease YdiL (CAAX protease family)
MKASINNHPLAFFFFIAFLFSWTIEINLIASQSGSLKISLPMGLHYLASFGPMAAALVVTWFSGGSQGLKDLWARITKWRGERKWIAFALLSPVIFFIFGTLVNFFLTKEWPDLSRIGQVNYLPNLGLGALVLWLATFGFGEEIGWRGFALPRLQKKYNALAATIILGITWIVWHIPTFFYHETYLEMGPFLLFGMAIGILFGGVMLTWLYNSSKGSILMVAIWHGLFDFFSASQANGPWVAPFISFCIIFLAIRILKVYPAETLSASEKQIQ